jgi:hypothetical protein
MTRTSTFDGWKSKTSHVPETEHPLWPHIRALRERDGPGETRIRRDPRITRMLRHAPVSELDLRKWTSGMRGVPRKRG